MGTTNPIVEAAAYGAASKAAALSLIRAAAAGYADQHLRVYTVCPCDGHAHSRPPDGERPGRRPLIDPSQQLVTLQDLA